MMRAFALTLTMLRLRAAAARSGDAPLEANALNRSISASEAPGGSIMAIGFPGTTRMTTKTITATPNRVISVVMITSQRAWMGSTPQM